MDNKKAPDVQEQGILQINETTDINIANEYLKNGWTLKLVAPVTRNNVNTVLYVLISPRF